MTNIRRNRTTIAINKSTYDRLQTIQYQQKMKENKLSMDEVVAKCIECYWAVENRDEVD